MWSNFEQSPAEDETISNVFSSHGVFKISSDEEVHHYPSVHAMVQNKRMVISIDKNLTLLEDEMVAKCISLYFNTNIDVIAISPSGNVLVCGLRDGEIHGIHIKGVLLYNVCIKVEDVHTTGKTFANVQQIDNDFFFICTNGSVYSLSEIDESVVESVLNRIINDSGSIPYDKMVLEDVSIRRLCTGRGISDVNAPVLLKNNSVIQTESQSINYLLIAESVGHLIFRGGTVDVTRIPLPQQYGGIKHTYNLEHIILALTNSGHLLEICPYTRIVNFCQFHYNFLIEDLLIMENNDENLELLILTKSTADGRFIKTIEYPSLKCHNELDVSEHSWLVRQPKSSVNLFYMTGKRVNEANIPTEVEMVLVSETHPSERFKKLIAKGHLEEAEEFGKQFELCLQPIFEAKAKHILIGLSNVKCNNNSQIQQKFQKLLELMSKIECRDFFKKHRMITLPTRQILEQYLKEILQRLDAKEDAEHVFEINEQLHRLKTLKIIDPDECNSDWQKFVYHTNLIKILKDYFKNDIPTACLIWKRHFYTMTPYLNDGKLRKLLNLLPSNTEAFYVVQWLRQFVPTVSNTHPSVMPYIAEWSIEKIRTLQYAELWPEIGLEFSTKILEIFEDSEFIYTDVRRKHEQNVSRLRDLVNVLQELSVLKTSYNLIFSLDSYMQGSMDDTALCILQRVHLDKLQSMVNDFLYPIFQEKGNTPVNAVKLYITKLVGNRNSLSNWLHRAVCCIELLHNIDDRLESALLVLQNSPVPWPDMVAPLIKLRTSTHPLALKICAEYEVQIIKIMAVKYGWPAGSVTNTNLQLLMMRIVKLNLPDMIDDIRVLTKAAPEISISANFNCCYQMARRGQIDLAYTFFKSLISDKEPKNAKDVVDILLNLLETTIMQINCDNVLEEHNYLIEFLKIIVKYGDASAEHRYLTIKNCFVLRHKFYLSLSCTAELISTEGQMKLLKRGIENIIERSQSTLNVYLFIASEVSELCALLKMQKVVGIYYVCKFVNTLPLTCALAYYVLSFVDCQPNNKQYFINIALELVAQQINLTKNSKCSSSSMHSITEYDPLALPLAYELLTAAAQYERKCLRDLYDFIKYLRVAYTCYELNVIEMHYCGREKEINEEICKALEMSEVFIGEATLNFTATMNGSFDIKPIQTKKRYSVSIFDEVDVLPQQQLPQIKARLNSHMPIITFVVRTLLLMVAEAKITNSFLLHLNQVLPEEIKQNVEEIREDFFLSLEKLIKVKEYDTWYIIAQYLLDFQKHHKCNKIINGDFVTLQLSRFFRSALFQKDVNFVELFTMLIAVDKHGMSLLERLSNDIKSDQQKMNFLTLSEIYNMHLDETDAVETIRLKRMKYFYYMEFCQQDPSIKGKFNADIDNIEQLLKEFHNKQLDVNLLERMSRDFGFDYQKLLITQVMSILSSQQLQYEVKTDAFGTEELVMLSTIKEMRDMCQPYINEIRNIDLLTSKLKQFIDEINIYFYELYLCVIEILLYFGALPKEMEIWTNILYFLKHKMITRRCNRPGQLETDMWLQSHKEIGVLPKIARYRLPFKPIVEQPLKDILDSELNVDNCQSWFPLIQMHTALKGSKETAPNCDYFCMSAVKNSIAEYKNKNDLETWNLHPTNNAFLKSILRLVRHVHNPCKAFLILYFVSNYAPDGADQVEAAYECWKYVIENETLINDPKCEEQLKKIKRKYPILKTQHLLYIYGLTDEKLMRLVESPLELIHSLYHHELILKVSKLDINGVVKEIAKLHNLDLETIQYKLLQKWLSFTIEPIDGTVLEETFSEDHQFADHSAGTELTASTTENVIRANYVLRSWPREEAVQYLISHILNPEGAVNTSEQLQMFECISKLDDGTTSINDMISQRQYITIKCVHDLKTLGYHSSVDKFADDNCNKIDILKIIWQRNSQNTLALEVMANICLGFDIYIPQIWNGILKRMILFNMIQKLNALVDILSCKSNLLHTDGLALAWDYVLQHSLKNANQTRTFAQEEMLQKVLLRLQTCPVVHALNLYQFAEHCVLIGRPHMAAVVLSFCNDSTELERIKKKILSHPVGNLRKEILELEDAGILPIILNFALKELKL